MVNTSTNHASIWKPFWDLWRIPFDWPHLTSRVWLKNKGLKKYSATGNRTPVSRVTGGDTHHYTIVELSILIFKIYLLFLRKVWRKFATGWWCVGGDIPPIKILVTHTFLNFVIAEDYPRAVRIYKSSVPKTGNRQKPETVKTETIHHIRRKQKEVDCKLYRHLIKRCDRDYR